MGRQSKIDRLPLEVRSALNSWLSDPAITQGEAHNRLLQLREQLDEDWEAPSIAGVNRYASKMADVGAKMTQAHQVADMWIDKFGGLPAGKLGELVINMIRTQAFDFTQNTLGSEIDDKDMPGMVSMLKDLSLIMQRTETAATITADRVKEIEREAKTEAATELQKVAKQQGLSAEFIETWKHQVLGIEQ